MLCFFCESTSSDWLVSLWLQIHGFVVVMDDAAFDDDVADQLLMSPQLIDQMLPPATKTA